MEHTVNILLVDDYPANLVALSAVLADEKYRLFEATSGPEALQIIATENIALVLLDIQMPGMDGYEVAEKIRANPLSADIPIIFITAVYREDPAVRKGYEVGGQDYMGKPFDPDVLRAKIGVYTKLFLKNTVLEKRTADLLVSEERYRLIVESVQEIIATVDVSGTVTSLNLAFERLTGLKSSEWVGKSFVPLINPVDLPKILPLFGESARQNVTQLARTEIKTVSGAWIPVEISVQPYSRDGHLLGSIGVIRDISHRN